MESPTTTIKCVIVGDGGVGKTCMLMSYKTNKFPTKFVPTVLENYTLTVLIKEKSYNLDLFDTVGQEDYDHLRPLSYPSTDVFLICFSVVDPNSLTNALERWLPEIRRHCSKTPFLLVGLQIDLRNDPETIKGLTQNQLKPITTREGLRLAKDLKAFKYVECSALTQIGLKNVFDMSIIATLQLPKEKIKTYKKCNIM